MMEWTAVVGAFIGIAGLWIQMFRMRFNDLKHLHERLNRIEQKLDEHLAWHLSVTAK